MNSDYIYIVVWDNEEGLNAQAYATREAAERDFDHFGGERIVESTVYEEIPSLPCITRTYFGGMEEISYDDWVNDIVQDEEEAYQIALDMLDNYPEEREFNSYEPPAFYETWFISNLDVFKACLDSARKENDENS